MTTTESTAVARAVTDLPGLIMDAWRRHDGTAFAELFVPDGTMVLPGVAVSGRDSIASFMTRAFAGPYRGTQVRGTPTAVRTIAPGVVLMMTEGGVAPDVDSPVPEDRIVRASWLAVADDDGWRLAAYQNTPRD